MKQHVINGDCGVRPFSMLFYLSEFAEVVMVFLSHQVYRLFVRRSAFSAYIVAIELAA